MCVHGHGGDDCCFVFSRKFLECCPFIQVITIVRIQVICSFCEDDMATIVNPIIRGEALTSAIAESVFERSLKSASVDISSDFDSASESTRSSFWSSSDVDDSDADTDNASTEHSGSFVEARMSESEADVEKEVESTYGE